MTKPNSRDSIRIALYEGLIRWNLMKLREVLRMKKIAPDPGLYEKLEFHHQVSVGDIIRFMSQDVEYFDHSRRIRALYAEHDKALKESTK
jgi:hypothetical protein